LICANQYEFFINEDGTYSPYPGLCGSLVRDDGPPITYTYTDTAQRVYTFNEAGQLTSLADPQGNAHHYIYDSGRLIWVEDDSGERSLTLTYDVEGRIDSVADHTGREVTFNYDPATGDLDDAIDLLGGTWEYSYDADHHRTEVIDPRGTTVERTEFDDQGRATHQYNGEGDLVLELSYNGFGTTIVHDARLNSEEQTYNGDNAIDRQIDALGGISSMSFDGNFRPETITDPAGATTTMSWRQPGPGDRCAGEPDRHDL
jgi:YD repeat-containing protein